MLIGAPAQTQTAVDSGPADCRWFAEKYFFLLACLLCGLPVWLPHFPPMVDIPQHAAQVSLFLNLGKPGFPFSEQFQVNWFTPYLLGYALVAIFTPLLGIVAACKLVIWLALAAFAFFTRIFLRQAGADPYWAWLTFPVLYGFTYQWGLLNFLVAAPVGILFLAVVWRQRARPDFHSSLLITLLLYLLLFSHALIMAFFSLIAVAYWLFSASRTRDFIKCAWPVFALAPMVLIWLFMSKNHPPINSPITWDLSWINSSLVGSYYSGSDHLLSKAAGWGRVTGFLPRLLGTHPELAVTLLGVTLFALPFLAGGRATRSRARLFPLLVITLILLLLPSGMFGIALNFQRFTYLVMPLFLVIIDRATATNRLQQCLCVIAPTIAFGWIFYMSNNALQFNKDAENFETILSQMEPGKRSLSLVFSRDDSRFIAPPFLHFPAWYSAINAGVTDYSFAATFMPPVNYKPGYIPKSTGGGLTWNPQSFDWRVYEGYKYDYFVVRSPVDVSTLIFKTATCRIGLAAHSGQWWLYRRDPRC